MTASPERLEDRAFAAWRRTGDPQHLGAVFDRVAGKLAILAVHLTRMPADAEDLVQATFVAAIESAARWDERQPVLPWLTGILANLVKMRQRQSQRVLEADRLRRPTHEQPAETAAWHEMVGDVTHALDALDETYRTVLMLRVLHGLRPAEIARALGRPQETVRTQLHRGLRLLRERLPRSLGVAALAGLLWPARGMAAVRTAVLAHAGQGIGAGAGSAAAIGLGGLLVMSSKTWTLLAAGIAVLAGITGVTAWQAFAPAGSPPIEANVAVDPAHVTATSQPVSMPNAPPAGSRRVATAAPATDAVPAARLAELRGRCVADENDAPLAGVRIELHGQAHDRDQPPAPWTDPDPVVTAADGQFVVRFDPPARHSFSVRTQHQDRVSMSARWSAWTPEAVLDVGDVRMPAGVPVRGLVHESDGTPRAARFDTYAAAVPFGSETTTAIQFGGHTNRDGRFDLGRMPAGSLRLEVREARVLGSTEFTVRPSDAATMLDVVVAPVDPDAVLAGIVVDEAGRPMAGVVLEAQETGGPRMLGSTKSAADGTFTLLCSAERGAKAMLDIQLPDSNERPARMDPPFGSHFAVGRRDLRVTIAAPPRPGTLTIQVVEAGTLQPVERFAVRCLPDPTKPRESRSSHPNRLRLAGSHPGGVLEIDEVPDEAMLLVVQPSEGDLLPSGPIAFTAPHTATLRVELHRRATGEIEVVRRDGRPVANTRVELLHGWGAGPPGVDTPAHSYTNPFRSCCPRTQAFLLGAGLTDEMGRVNFAGPSGQDGLSVRILGPGCVATVVHPATWTGKEPLRCVVDTGATIEGRVLPADFFARMRQGAARRAAAPGVKESNEDGVGLHLVEAGAARRELPVQASTYPVATDGSFRIDGIPPGAWAVEAHWLTEMGSGSRLGTNTGPWTTLTLSEGQVARVELDLQPLAPARLRGRLLLDGEPLPRAQWELHAIRSPMPPFRLQWVGGQATNADGRFECAALPPGTYRLRAYRDREHWFDDAELTVAPGTEMEHESRLGSHRLLVRLQDQDGKRARAGRVVRYTFPLGRLDDHFEIAETDAEGIATFAFAPPFAVKITVLDRGGETEFWKLSMAGRDQHMIELGTVPAPRADQREIDVTFRLPAAAR